MVVMTGFIMVVMVFMFIEMVTVMLVGMMVVAGKTNGRNR